MEKINVDETLKNVPGQRVRKTINECTPEEWNKASHNLGRIDLPVSVDRQPEFPPLVATDALTLSPIVDDKDPYAKGVEEYWDVHHPNHYTKGRKYEPWDVVDDWNLNYFAGTALKYISRYERKGSPVTDLKKAIQFLEKEIERLKRK
jgi:hypothetical protein